MTKTVLADIFKTDQNLICRNCKGLIYMPNRNKYGEFFSHLTVLIVGAIGGSALTIMDMRDPSTTAQVSPSTEMTEPEVKPTLKPSVTKSPEPVRSLAKAPKAEYQPYWTHYDSITLDKLKTDLVTMQNPQKIPVCDLDTASGTERSDKVLIQSVYAGSDKPINFVCRIGKGYGTALEMPFVAYDLVMPKSISQQAVILEAYIKHFEAIDKSSSYQG